MSSINIESFGDDDNNIPFTYDEELPIIRDNHGYPIFDREAAAAARHNDNEDPTLHMQNLKDHYQDIYNEGPLQEGMVIDEGIENVTYSNNPSNFDTSDWKTYREKCPDNKDWTREYSYEGKLPSYHIALIDLLKILDRHQVDLKVFDSIVEWVMHNSLQDPSI